MEKERILFCDIDDVIINSAPRIQNFVQSNTIFKTDILNALEQFKRNCQYYYDCILEEYKLASADGRKLNLEKFPNIGNYDNNTLYNDGSFTFPLANAAYFLNRANMLLEEFLEERDMFLELDDLPYGQRKIYDFEKEKLTLNEFKVSLYNSFEALEQINIFCLQEVRRISSEAKKMRSYPQYGALVQMDSNDIIRTNENMDDWNYRFYEKPCLDVLKCFKSHVVQFAIKNFERKEDYSKEIVDYDSIYIPDNVNKEAIAALKKIMLSGKIDKICFITHHNGMREEYAKKRLVSAFFPEADFLGMRFHSTEHNLKRRGRSSKYDNAAKVYDMNNIDCVLLDDSKDNCNDWYKKGGKAIIYRKTTDAEKIGHKVEFDYPRIENFESLEETLDETFAKVKMKGIK